MGLLVQLQCSYMGLVMQLHGLVGVVVVELHGPGRVVTSSPEHHIQNTVSYCYTWAWRCSYMGSVVQLPVQQSITYRIQSLIVTRGLGTLTFRSGHELFLSRCLSDSQLYFITERYSSLNKSNMLCCNTWTTLKHISYGMTTPVLTQLFLFALSTKAIFTYRVSSRGKGKRSPCVCACVCLSVFLGSHV